MSSGGRTGREGRKETRAGEVWDGRKEVGQEGKEKARRKGRKDGNKSRRGEG